MLDLLDVVRVRRDIPERGVRKGDVGTIVETLTVPDEAYEVEFLDAGGEFVAEFALSPEDIEHVDP